MLSQFFDQRTMFAILNLKKKIMLKAYATHPCHRVCVKWMVNMPLGNILFEDVSFCGVYVSCINCMPRWTAGLSDRLPRI